MFKFNSTWTALFTKKIICLGLLLASSLHAAIHPPGGQIGTEVEALITGAHEIWPPTFWCSESLLKFEALEKKGRVKITIPKELNAGPVLVRTIYKKSVSKAHVFVLSNHKEIQEIEPNNHLQEAQEIKGLPLILNGRLEKNGDTDFFHIHLEKGQQLSAKMAAYSLFSPLDSFIHILGPDGFELEVASDTHNLDPHLQYQAQITGRHSLQILAIPSKASTSIQYTGNEESVYRLSLTIDDDKSLPPDADIVEADAPNLLPIPSTRAGTLIELNETDIYHFEAKKGDLVIINVEAYSLQYPTDPVLKVCNREGALIKEVDDGSRNNPDAEYQLRVTKDDTYQIKIEERYGNSGKHFHYRLSLDKPKPSFDPTIDKDLLTGTPGKEVSLKITLNRINGHKDPLYVLIPGLPNDVFVKGVDLSGDAKDATLTFSIPEKAKAGNYPCRIQLIDQADPRNNFQHAAYSFQSNESRGDYLINDTPVFWLTIPEKEKTVEKSKKDTK